MKKKRAKGQTAVEFALAMPLILAMLGAGYDFGNVIYVQQHLNQAAYEATKLIPQVKAGYSTSCSPCDIPHPGADGKESCLNCVMENRAKRVLQDNGIKSGEAVVTFVGPKTFPTAQDGNYIVQGLEINYNYPFLVGLLTTALHAESAVVTMKEQK